MDKPPGKIYALLVGINEYQAPTIRNLGGCEQDVNKIEAYLTKRFGTQVVIQKLLNAAATRSAIIQHFREHLGQANSKDTALFYYTGHGSTEPAPTEFVSSTLESNTLENLVCYDAKTEGVWNIADKELRLLLAELSAKGPHIVTIFDSCHSGSITRNDQNQKVQYRRFEDPSAQPRPISAFLDDYYAQQWEQSGTLEIPIANYIALSACAHDELATEVYIQGGFQGVFTSALLQALESFPDYDSYADLFLQVRQSLQAGNWAQNPQFEYFGRVNPYARFLDGTAGIQPNLPLLQKDADGYYVTVGALQGIENVSSYEAPLFEKDQPNIVVQKVAITKVLLDSCRISLPPGFTPSSDKEYRISLPGAPLPLTFVDSDKYTNDLLTNPANAYLVKEAPHAQYEWLVKEDQYLLYKVHPKRELIHGIDQRGKKNVNFLKGFLEKIARWERIQQLTAPRKSLLNAHQFDCMFHYETAKGAQQVVVGPVSPGATNTEHYKVQLSYQEEEGPIPYQFRLTNNSDYALHFYLLHLDAYYGIKQKYENHTVKLGPGQSILLYNSELEEVGLGIPTNTPSITEYFLLIASHQPIQHLFALEQEGINPYTEWGQISYPLRTAPGTTDSQQEVQRGLKLKNPKPRWSVKKLEIRIESKELRVES